MSRLLSVLLLAGLAGPLSAAGEEELVVHAHELSSRSAEEVLAVVLPLLSPEGSVEVQNGGRTVIIRDRLGVLSEILPIVRRFDHLPRPLEVRLQVVRVRRTQGEEERERGGQDLADPLRNALRQIIPFDDFDVVARAEINAFEGEAVTYDVSPELRVEFRLGSVAPIPFGIGTGEQARLKIHGFRLVRIREGREEELIHSHLNTWLGRPYALGLAPSADSPQALVVVIECKVPPKTVQAVREASP